MKNKEKVLHLIADMGNGGAERQLIELLSYNRHHILLTLRGIGHYKKYLDGKKIRFIEMNVRYPISLLIKIFYILKIIKNEKVEIIQCWMYNACLIGFILNKISRIKKPIIWSIRCSNMVLSYYSVSLKIIIFLCKKLSNTPNYIIYNSKSGFNFHQGLGFRNKNSKIIVNGIDEKKFYFSNENRIILRNKYNIKNEDFLFICVARVDPMKGHKVLLQAFKEARKNQKKIKLILVGKGTEHLKLPNGAKALGMQINIYKYYSMADAVILTSIFGEGFPNVIVEGMLSQLVPLSSDVGDAREIIKGIGFLCKVNSVESIKENMLRLVSLSKKGLKNKGLESMLKAKSKYGLKNMNDSYKKIYNGLV